MAAAIVLGSSPRVRGTRSDELLRGLDDRFIPACAGNSSSSSCSTRAGPGSSPRVRGTLIGGGGGVPCSRFIPACAGNSSVRPNGNLTPAGSSPRVRGTLLVQTPRTATHRFIPACAGNSPPPSVPPMVVSVHPRVCGELRRRRSDFDTQFGSSPRVRGTRRRRCASRPAARFIPACAGNSENSRLSRSCVSVHPRVCGELARREHGAGAALRFIPACAGNSAPKRS